MDIGERVSNFVEPPFPPLFSLPLHLAQTCQLQELMEKYCMSSIRKEMRVTEKLAPNIIGPTLETATQILDRVYSKHTKVAQEVRESMVRSFTTNAACVPSPRAIFRQS